MSTPDFVPQNSTNLTTVRYYTEADPYHYTVDNRPLQDLAANLVDARSNGADSARRAVLINALLSSANNLATSPVPTGFTYSATGLAVSQPGANQITVGQGSVYVNEAVNTAVATNIIKQAVLLAPTSFSIPTPGSAGQSLVYTIEGTVTDLSQANMASSALPYVDATNPYLASTLLGKELVVSLNTGTPAATGSETAPSTTAGKFPLYNITTVNGSSVIRVWAHPNSPKFAGATHDATISAASTGSASFPVIQDTFSALFADGADQAVSLGIPVNRLNPFNNLKVRLTFSPSATGGNIVFRVKYKGLTSTDLITATRTVGVSEAVAVTVAANGVQTVTLNTSIVPNSEFANLVSGAWTVAANHLTLLVERVGTSGLDTSTANVSLLNAVLVQ